MPVGFSSAARNLFLLGSSGADVVTNFFKTIDQSAGTDGVYIPDEIKYNVVDQKYVLAGSAADSNSKSFGWLEKRDNAGTADWDVRIEAGAGINTTLRAMELDSNNNLIVAGRTGDAPWIAKYSNGGVIDWQSTTFSGDVTYTGVASDSSGNYYACGRTDVSNAAQAFVEKYDTSGTPDWGKSAFMLGRDVILRAIDSNSRGEVVTVGSIEDDSSIKGYIIKLDTNTGNVLWDRTLTSENDFDGLAPYQDISCRDVYIDSNDQIYVVGEKGDDGFIVKYTAEGNIIWQKKTNQSSGTISFNKVHSDGETEQTIVFGRYNDQISTVSGLLSKYSKNGDLVWRRTLTSSFNNSDTFANTCLDADPSFYYLMYTDSPIDGLNGTPDKYTFGKVSSSGNGLGDFQYAEGTGETIDYEILNVGDTISRLSDGSVRNDSSDLISYPFNGTKILFDDLATHVSNKKRQMDGPDSFEYSGSPAIRPADFQQELNLLGDTGIVASTTTGSAVIYSDYFYGGGFNHPAVNAFDGSTSTRAEPSDNKTIYVDFSHVNPTGTLLNFNSNSKLPTYLNQGGDAAGDGLRSNPIYRAFDGSTSTYCDMTYLNGQFSRLTFENPITNVTNITIGYDGEGDPGYNGGNHTTNVSFSGSRQTVQLYNGSAITLTDLDFISQPGNGVCRLYDVTITVGGTATTLTLDGGVSVSSSLRTYLAKAGSPSANHFTVNVQALGGSVPSSGWLTINGVTKLRQIALYHQSGSSSVELFAVEVDGSILTDGSGLTVVPGSWADQSGKGNSGIVYGATHNAAGYWEFDGTDDYITLGTQDFITTQHSVEMWVNISAAKEHYLFSFGYHDDVSALFYAETSTQELIVTWRVGGVNQSPILTGELLATNQWYHILWTRDGATNKIYLDGVEVGSSTSQTTVSLPACIYDIGWATTRDKATAYTQGKVGDVRIYSKALTAAQAFQNYNATKETYTGVAASINPGLTSTRTP